MKKLFATLVLGLCVSSKAQTLIGLADCGEWVKDMTYATSNKSWLLGYISGLNRAGLALGQANLLKDVGGEQLLLWMDNYCKAHPLDNVPEAADKLAVELGERARARAKR